MAHRQFHPLEAEDCGRERLPVSEPATEAKGVQVADAYYGLAANESLL
jgi:hypothetical protein